MSAAPVGTVLGLLAELRGQGWTLSPSPDNSRWRAEPPDAKRKVVHFPARPNDMTAVLRELCDQGFRWPPPKKVEPPAPVLRAAPFPPKAHPEVTTEPPGALPPSAPRGALALVRSSAPASPDVAFQALKEARELRLMCAAEYRELDQVAAEAIKRRDESKAMLDEAAALEAQNKAAFDELFAREEA